MAILVLREYERIRKGERSDFANHTMSPVQHAALTRLAEDYASRFGVRVLQYGPHGSLVAQNYVGVLNIGQDQVEIMPKIDSPQHELRRNFMRMLAVALELELYGGENSAVGHSQDTILEAVITLFCSSLWRALRGGMLRQYVRREEQLSTLKGRLLLTRHLRDNMTRPDRATCEFDEFTEDNAPNRILRLALKILRQLARSTANQSRIAELMFCFQDVADVPPAQLAWQEAKTTRHTARYQPLLAMARLIIEGFAPDVLSGQRAGFALLFDMNELFELYIGAMVRKAVRGAGVKVSLQGPSLYLARHEDDRPAFKLKPDIVIKRDGRTAYIVDTKWKRLKPDQPNDGVSAADIYQMHAYASRYDAPEVILLYPHHTALDEQAARRNRYRLSTHDGQASQRSIAVSTIDLTNLDNVPRQLELMIGFGKPDETGC